MDAEKFVMLCNEYGTAQVQRHTRLHKSICLRLGSHQLKGCGTYYTHEFSSCKKQGEYSQVKRVPCPFNWRLPNREQIDSCERVRHCTWAVLYVCTCMHEIHTYIQYTYIHACMHTFIHPYMYTSIINK